MRRFVGGTHSSGRAALSALAMIMACAQCNSIAEPDLEPPTVYDGPSTVYYSAGGPPGTFEPRGIDALQLPDSTFSRIVPNSLSVVAPAVSRSGKWVATTMPGSNLWISRHDGQEGRQLSLGFLPSLNRVEWTPEETHLVVARSGGDLELVDVANGSSRPLFGADIRPFQPSLSPDGRIVFVRGFGHAGLTDSIVLFVGNRDGTGIRQLTRAADGDATYPAWSPTGEWIAFRVFESGQPDGGIYLIGPDGSDRRRLFSGEYPTWSPDGKKLAFTRGVPTSGGLVPELYIGSLTGDTVRMTHDLASKYFPSWGRVP